MTTSEEKMTLWTKTKPLFKRFKLVAMNMNIKYYRNENPVRVELNGILVGNIHKENENYVLKTTEIFKSIEYKSCLKMDIVNKIEELCTEFILNLFTT